jgi:predicted lipid-binding transport protein (Tim44 family)
MKKSIAFLIFVLTLGLAALDADAARRFGGGGNLGRQRPAPTLREAPREAPAPAPSRSAQPAPAPAPGMTPPPAPRPSFMQRWGGVLAGLGLGALLGSLFGGHLGGAAGSLIMLLILAALVYMVIRALAGRRRVPAGPYAANAPSYEPGATYDAQPQGEPRSGFSGIGRAIPAEGRSAESALTALPSGPEPTVLQPDEVEPFLRVAKTSFIRLQAANDAGDLDDIRDYTTPEMYAEIAMQLRERHAAQKTEVVDLDAQLVGTGVEDAYAYASVRFKGRLREAQSGETETFDEIWNVRRKLSDPRSPWLIAGIQQAA